MKRRAFKLVVLLLLGAIVNVAVAWGCVCRIERQSLMERLVDDDRPMLVCNGSGLSTQSHNVGVINTSRTSMDISVSWARPVELLSETEFEDCLPRWSALKDFAPPSRGCRKYGSTDAAEHLWEVGAGWPAIALHGATIHEHYARPSTRVGLVHLPLKQRRGPDRVSVPYWPLWPGFAINAVFYAGILWGGWLLFAAPFALRRRRRIKRGLCPACAYPVGASTVCTECGKPVDQRSALI